MMSILRLPAREMSLRKRIKEACPASHQQQQAEATTGTNAMQEVQADIYGHTGLFASEHFGEDDLAYLHKRLPRMTREMLRLAGRDEPMKMTMYDLRHSLISCGGADAAVKVEQAKRVAKAALSMIESRIKSTNGDGEITPVRLLELGSGISDVSSMVWHLIMKGIDSKKLHTKAGPNCQPQSLFEIVDIEYEQTTGTTAAKLMAECGRDNITVRYGPQIGDATRLEGLEDNSFDIVWSSLMLGAFGDTTTINKSQATPAMSPCSVTSNDEHKWGDDALEQSSTTPLPTPSTTTTTNGGLDEVPPMARAVTRQAYRVTRDGGFVMHTDFVYLYGRDDVPWAVDRSGVTAMLPMRLEAAVHGRWDGLTPADHHIHRKNISPFFKKLNQVLTDDEFNYWAWFDGGDFAAWELKNGMTKGHYSDVEVKRFCGAVPSVPLAALALSKLYLNKWETMSEEELEETASHCKQAGTAFTMVVGTVKKQ